MNNAEWNELKTLKERFKSYCITLSNSTHGLIEAQQALVDERAEQSYKVKTPVVYNETLDDIKQDDKIKLLFVGDNPGRREQNDRRYLIGPSGKIAENFFINNKCLDIDFRKEVIILNKTPIHTPRTLDLKILGAKNSYIQKAIRTSQKEMALILLEFERIFKVPVWITGYSEMKKNGIFAEYTAVLTDAINECRIERENIHCFRHFSMNQFTIDLNKQREKNESICDALNRIGSAYRERIFV
ncbi:MAG: uracil-DNA glycosylase family protein [Spirochaetaceae bacterium]|jgi:hypothetical protein|nr:uracil-DNA glycosylase family protein [Spirochaetaceae bacterium]